MNKLVFRKGVFFEGDNNDLRAIHPTPIISSFSCSFIHAIGGDKIIFREDSFDPVTRIRRGRLYVGGKRPGEWPRGRIDYGIFHPYVPSGTAWTPEAVYDAWRALDIHPQDVNGHVVQIGAYGYLTSWRIVGAELLEIDHVLLTLRANTLLGVLPELITEPADQDGNPIKRADAQRALEALSDAFQRQQPTPTVDVARETARVILTAWIGDAARGKDLDDVNKEIPSSKRITRSTAEILRLLHPRGKSAAIEKHAQKGAELRPITEVDAEASVHLISLLLRELGWAMP